MTGWWRLVLTAVVLAVGGPVAAGATVATQDSLTVQCAPAPGGTCDESGAWQTSATTVTFLVTTAAADSIQQATPGCRYFQPQLYTDVKTTVSCEVWWSSGAVQLIAFPLNVQASNPTAIAVPTRPPDSSGWYNHPVTVLFRGAASFSGFNSSSCTQITYSGPDTSNTTVTGSCTDNAGKAAYAGLQLRYDSTPPCLHAGAEPGDGMVIVRWRACASVEIVRSPGLHGHKTDTLARGPSGVLTDVRVRNGVRYRYMVTAKDQADNVATRSIVVRPGRRLLAPARNARLTASPVLRWTPVRGATYYNVQLYRGAAKVLSAWPGQARLRLRHSWVFDGRGYALGPDKYRWFVWPGFGARAAARYGSLIGRSGFVVTRPKT